MNNDMWGQNNMQNNGYGNQGQFRSPSGRPNPYQNPNAYGNNFNQQQFRGPQGPMNGQGGYGGPMMPYGGPGMEPPKKNYVPIIVAVAALVLALVVGGVSFAVFATPSKAEDEQVAQVTEDESKDTEEEDKDKEEKEDEEDKAKDKDDEDDEDKDSKKKKKDKDKDKDKEKEDEDKDTEETDTGSEWADDTYTFIDMDGVTLFAVDEDGNVSDTNFWCFESDGKAYIQYDEGEYYVADYEVLMGEEAITYLANEISECKFAPSELAGFDANLRNKYSEYQDFIMINFTNVEHYVDDEYVGSVSGNLPYFGAIMQTSSTCLFDIYDGQNGNEGLFVQG